MKRFGYAAGAVVLTSLLVMLAIAIAQRDARTGDSSSTEANLPYANQTAQPISLAENSTLDAMGPSQSWPPAPIIRGNDSENDRDTNPLGLAVPPTSARLTSYEPPLTSLGTESERAPSLPPLPPAGFSQPQLNDTTKLAEPPPLVDSNSFSSSFPGSVHSPQTLVRGTDPSQPSGISNAPPSNASSLPAIPDTRISKPVAQNPPQNNLPSNALPPSLPGGIASSPFAASTLPSNASNGSAYSNSESRDNLPPTLSSMPPAASESGRPFSSASNSSGTASNPMPPVATLGAPQPSVPNPSTSTFDARNTSPAVAAPSAMQTYPYQSQSVAGQGVASGNAARSPGNGGGSNTSATFISAAPGMRQLDGSQNPSMEIQKRAPNEVQVGVASTFTVLVRNVGNATAYEVQVVDAVPKGAKLVRTSPAAIVGADQSLVWKLGEMPAGAEKILSIELIPETEGEIGSVASVNFAAQASVRTISTQPKLAVKQLFEPMILGGETMRIMIEITNSGTGTARNVRLQEDVPPIFRHATGSSTLELSLYDLAPGESVKQEIDLTAVSAGKATNIMRAISENAATSESAAQIEVVSPKLEVTIEGASLRYLERQVTYRLAIRNTGTAIARDVDLTLYLPAGLQFNSTINQGSYVPKQHAVYWSLSELAAGAHVVTDVTLLPVEEGNYVLRLQCQGKEVRAEPIEKPVRIEGQSELAFSIEDDNDPIETDGRTTYIVRISNVGTRNDNNVELQVELPEGAVAEQVSAPVEYRVSQRNIIFAPIPQLSAKDQQTIRLLIRHAREGIHVVRAQLKSKLRPTPVSKEESTEVYRDR